MNTIDWRQLRSITARQIINALVRDGFELHNQRGSHQRYHHVAADARRSRFRRPSDTFALGTLRSMVERQAWWSRDELVRLELL